MQIRLNQVEKKFNKTVVLSDVTAEIPQGTVGAVIGLNGAGKTTLLRLIAGVLVPNQGSVHYDGAAFDRRNMALRRRMCFLPDELPVMPDQSALRHASMVFSLYGKDVEPIKDQLMDLYEGFDLLPVLESPLNTLSRGQVYKAVLAPILILSPELWLVDEPFAAGMDPEGMRIFREYARRAADRGCTVLFSTQILEIAESFADMIYVLHQGRLVKSLPVSDLKTQLGEGKVGGEVMKILGRLREEVGDS